MTVSICILDDETSNVERWTTSVASVLKDDHTIKVHGTTDFRRDVEELEGRRVRARAGEDGQMNGTVFDESAIVIVDYDLIGLSREHYLTGETVAYLARCYSRCSIVVLLNQFGDNPFDLTLRGHPASFADLNIGSEQIANPGLWGGVSRGFRPWAWPDLLQQLGSFERRARELLDGRIDEPIVSVLRMPPTMLEVMPRSAREIIDVHGEAERITVREFVLSSEFALRRKDRLLSDEAIARVGAARLATWLDSLVLPEQDILVDAPHLIERFPSLVLGDASEVHSWNRAARLGVSEDELLRADVISDHRWKASDWLSRPAWFGKEVAAEQKLPEVKDPWSRPDLKTRFCEDLSSFLPRDGVREFVAELESPHVRRFVADPESPLLGEIAPELRKVDYRPAVRLSL